MCHRITPRSRSQTFDRNLSLAIDLCHWQIDALRDSRGAWTWLYRAWLRFRLHRLEERIPHD